MNYEYRLKAKKDLRGNCPRCKGTILTTKYWKMCVNCGHDETPEIAPW